MHTDLQSAILAALRVRHPEAMTEIEIWEQVSNGQIAMTTVYIACADLEKAGLIESVESGKKWKLTDTGKVGQPEAGVSRKTLPPEESRWRCAVAKKKSIPGLSRQRPPDIHFIIAHGHLMDSERVERGFRRMHCGECQERYLDFIWAHTPWTEEEISKTGKSEICECGEIHGMTIPGMVWGEDITPICPCCSFPHCPHKDRKLSPFPPSLHTLAGEECSTSVSTQDAPLREAAESSRSGHGFAPSPAGAGDTESCDDNLHASRDTDAVILPAGLSDSNDVPQSMQLAGNSADAAESDAGPGPRKPTGSIDPCATGPASHVHPHCFFPRDEEECEAVQAELVAINERWQ